MRPQGLGFHNFRAALRNTATLTNIVPLVNGHPLGFRVQGSDMSRVEPARIRTAVQVVID